MPKSDLFKINFKKPTLSSDELIKEEKRLRLNSKFEAIYSRLESIEILNSNGKYEDSYPISILLAQDLVNLSLFYYGKPETSIGRDWKAELAQLKIDKLMSVYGKYDHLLTLSLTMIEKNQEKLEELESSLSNLVSDLETYFKALKKIELNTALSEQIFRWKVQATTLALIITTVLVSLVYRKVKYPDLAKTEVKIFLLSKSEPSPKEENAVSKKISLDKKGEWVDYEFELPKVTDIIEVRIDPIEQSKVRFATEYIKFYDSRGKLIYTHDFVWGDDLLPKEKLSYGAINELKMSGKSIPGEAFEMESLGSDPFFHVRIPEIKGISKVQLKMRHIEAYKKFK